MKKLKTPSFILEQELLCETFQFQVLEKRFEVGRHIYNYCVKELLKRYNLYKQSKAYQNICIQLKGIYKLSDKDKKKKLLSRENKKLKDLQLKFGLSEYHIHDFVKGIKHNYDSWLDINTAQKIATQTWNGMSKVLYGSGKKVHFKKFGYMTSLEGKDNKTGIKYRNGFIDWSGLKVPIITKPNDIFAKECLLSCRIKFIRIYKKTIRGKDRFYAQLVMEGTPPPKRKRNGDFKHNFEKENRVGLDIGTSSVAVCSRNEVFLQKLGAKIEKIDKEIVRTQKYMDRSRKATNPNKFNEDGTFKKGSKDKWVRSKNYIKALHRLKETYRKKTAILTLQHNILSNRILELGNEIYCEQMNFSALAKRMKETKINKKGKFQSKKRFGKSILNCAPSKLLSILDRKLRYQGLSIKYVNTWKFKASQYNHAEDDYKKVPLSARWKEIDGHKVQRDIYSAFLIMNSKKNLEEPDKELCDNNFDNFLQLHNKGIQRLLSLNVKLPSSFGLK